MERSRLNVTRPKRLTMVSYNDPPPTSRYKRLLIRGVTFFKQCSNVASFYLCFICPVAPETTSHSDEMYTAAKCKESPFYPGILLGI
jgi:hypothetical protein